MRLLFLALACSFLAVGEYRIASSQDAGAHRDRPSQRWLPQPDGAGGNVLDQLRVLEQLRRQMAADSSPAAMPELTEDQLQVLDQAYQTWIEQSGGAQLPDWDSIPKEWVDQALANPEQLRAAQRLIQQYVRQRKIPSPGSFPSLPKDWKFPWQGGSKDSKAIDSDQPDAEAKRSASPSGEAADGESQASTRQSSAPRDSASSKLSGSPTGDAKNAARRKQARPDGDAPDSDAADRDAADRDATESDPFRVDRAAADDDVPGEPSLGGADSRRDAKARAASGKTDSAGLSSSSTEPSAADSDATGPFQTGSSRRAPGASAPKSPSKQTDAAQLKALRELLEKAVQAAGPSAGAARSNAPARRPEPNQQAGARGSAAQPMPRAPGSLYPRQSMTPLPSPARQAIPPNDPRSDAAPLANELSDTGDQPDSNDRRAELGADVSADSGLFYSPSPLSSNAAAASNSSAGANRDAQRPAGPRGAAAGASAQHAASSTTSTDFGAGNWDLQQLGAEASAKLLTDNSQAALQEKIKRDVQQLGWNGALHRIIQETFQEEIKASQSQPATKPNSSVSNTKAHETKRGASHMLNIDTSSVRKHLPNFFSDGRVASALAEVWKAIANAPLSHSDNIASALPSGSSVKHHSHKSKSGSQLGFGGNEVRIALVMVAAVALAVWVGRKRPAWFGVEQPIDPRWAKEVLAEGIRTRADVIRAFHRLVAQTTEPVASWWTHRYVARRLAEAAPQLATAMADLSSVYEQARYMPPEAELSSEQISRVCRALRECVAYGNSNSAADATS